MVVVVVSCPVRATPTTVVRTGRSQSRSTNSMAASAIPSTRRVDSSWARSSRHPAYQPSVVSYARCAERGLRETSVVWAADARGACRAARRGGSVAKVRTRAVVPFGSAYRSRWQGITSPSPVVLSVVARTDQLRPPTYAVTSCAVSIASGGSSAGASGWGSGRAADPDVLAAWARSARVGTTSRSRVGRTPAPSVTSEPVRTSAATAATAPATVWVRRRAAPARRRMVGRGHCAVSTWRRSPSKSTRMLVVGTSRWTANWAVAVWSSRSASAGGSPTSRAMSAIETVVRWVSSSVLRCVTGSLPSAARVARSAGARPFSRRQSRPVCRRCACDQACGRAHDSGSSRREILRQWCQATTKESRTAARDAARSPVSA